MSELKAGLSAENTFTVSKEMVIDFLGDEGAVLATPMMIYLMEQTCRKMIKPYLKDNEESLGVRIDAKHLGATPLGMNVTIKASLVEVDGKKCIFNVQAFDEREKVGEALHERFIVNKNKFLEKLKKKSS